MNKDLRIAILKKFDNQSNFAQLLRVQESKISQVVHGRKKLSQKEAKKWMKLLGCDFKVFNSITKS